MFSFSDILQACSPSDGCRDVLSHAGAGEGECGERAGTTLCKEAFWRWGCRTGEMAEPREARASFARVWDSQIFVRSGVEGSGQHGLLQSKRQEARVRNLGQTDLFGSTGQSHIRRKRQMNRIYR